MVAEIRSGSHLPVAMGDEQGGSYQPEVLLEREAVDVIRIDVTTNGGISRLRRLLARIEESGTPFAPRMFAHVHSRVFAALRYSEVAIEWGVPGSGVDQYADSLPQLVIRDGLMNPLLDKPGLGRRQIEIGSPSRPSMTPTSYWRSYERHCGFAVEVAAPDVGDPPVRGQGAGVVHGGPGATHLCQGQEAVAVGAVAALDEGDFLAVTYRGHGHALARGLSIEACFAELMGRTSGWNEPGRAKDRRCWR